MVRQAPRATVPVYVLMRLYCHGRLACPTNHLVVVHIAHPCMSD